MILDKIMKKTDKEKDEYMQSLAWSLEFEERGRILLKIPKKDKQLISARSIYKNLKEKKKIIDEMILEFDNYTANLKKKK